MHVNFGIIPPLAERVRGKRERYAAYSQRAVEDLERFLTDSANAPYGGNRV
jgi:methylenetetrahydrofolate--tRNA-(uracil-5-)-methyltransferase